MLNENKYSQKCPNKQSNLVRYPQLRHQEDSFDDSTSRMLGLSKQSKISEIKVSNCSMDSLFFDKSSVIEQNLEQELNIWKEQYKIDPQIAKQVEQQIRNIDTQITQLQTQFEVCINLQRQTESYFIELQSILKGTQFIKFSRSNSKNFTTRTILYCPFLNALCWKSRSSKFPTSKQMIPIDQIICIHTNYQKYKFFKKGFVIPKNLNEELFFAIEARNGNRLELIAETKQDQDLYIRVLNQLIQQSDKSFNTNYFIEQYNKNINQTKKSLEISKNSFVDAIDKLQQQFISTTSTLLTQEREKVTIIKRRSSHKLNLNKQQIDELGLRNTQQMKQISDLKLEKEYLEQRIIELQEFYNSKQMQIKNSSDPVIQQINQILRNIINLNGEMSICTESINDVDECQDYAQDCMNNLKIVQDILINSQNLEINLRAKVDELNQYVKECEQVNKILENKLLEMNQTMEQKVSQFLELIKEMQTLKQYSQQSIKLDVDYQEFYCVIIAFLSYLIIPDELNNDSTQLLQGLIVKLSEKYKETLSISSVIRWIKALHQYFIQQDKNSFEKQMKEITNKYTGLQSKRSLHSPTSTTNSQRILLDKTFNSPNNKVFLKNTAKFYRKDSQSHQSPLDAQQIKYLSQLIK